MSLKYKYYNHRRCKKVFYATDENNNIYFFNNYSYSPDYWQKATWKKEIKVGISYVSSLKKVEIVDEDYLKKVGLPLISHDTVQDQLPHEYFQDYEDEWIYFAWDENNNIYIYRDPEAYKYDKTPPGKWERVLDSDFMQYCLKHMMLLQKSTPRSKEHLLKNDIPLIKEEDVIKCTENHIYT